MSHHSQYTLRVSAGATYNTSKDTEVPVNSEKPLPISSEHLDAQIRVRIKDYRGLPTNSPSTSPYFSSPAHPYDRYSISFSFVPKEDIRGDHLVFGNDFEHPIRDRLPPLFDKAFGIVKWWIDPGLEGDVYGDEPYLYGPLLSSINVFCVGDKGASAQGEAAPEDVEDSGAVVYSEGAVEGSDGDQVRKEIGIPATSAARQKFFLTPTNREKFVFEKGREYRCDFFNPYLDFNEFALKIGYGLPNISIIGHWDGQPLRTHSLRYTLKNKETNTELFVVVIQLQPTEEAKAELGFEEDSEVRADAAGLD